MPLDASLTATLKKRQKVLKRMTKEDIQSFLDWCRDNHDLGGDIAMHDLFDYFVLNKITSEWKR